MDIFGIGDRVKTKSNNKECFKGIIIDEYCDPCVGCEYEVKNICGEVRWFYDEELELDNYSAYKVPQLPKITDCEIKIGDRVRCGNVPTYFIVLDIEPPYYKLQRISDCVITQVPEDWVELVECGKQHDDIEKYKKIICEKNKLILDLDKGNKFLRDLNTDKIKQIYDLKRTINRYENKENESGIVVALFLCGAIPGLIIGYLLNMVI